MRRAATVAIASLLALTGYAALDAVDVAPGILTLAPPPDPPAPTTAAAPSAPVALPSLPAERAPLAPAGSAGPLPTPDGTAAAVDPVLALPALQDAAVTVRDGTTGEHLLDRAADQSRPAASTVKLLTAVAVHRAFPAGTTLSTRLVRGAAPDQVVLVAGGDTLLAPGAGDPAAVAGRAGLADLADRAAAALQATGTTRVDLVVDLSYAPGPPAQPSWPDGLLAGGFTDRITTLGLATQRARPGPPAPADPVGATARALAARLTERGVAAAYQPGQVSAPQPATTLAEVTSAPVEDLLALALTDSDNALTETLARQAAARQGQGADATAAYVLDSVRAAGVDVAGVHLADACGLSRETVVPARVLADVVLLGTTGRVPRMADTVRRLPVARLSGTLDDRFAAPQASAGAGVVRAKTGTLTGVNALAGTVVTAEGRLLVLVVVAQGTATGTPTTRAALDRFGATLAACGCR